MTTARVARLTRTELERAVAGAASWRAVGRRLGLRAARDVVAVRWRCVAEGVPTGDLPDHESDAVFRALVAAARAWAPLLVQLGYSPGSGSARATVRARARRLGVGLEHLDAPTAAERAWFVGPRSREHLRAAGPLLVAAELLRRGCSVSWPLEPTGYDLVVGLPADGGQRLLRVQVKTGTRRAGGSWVVPLARGTRTGRRPYAREEVDAFGLVDGDGEVYLLPIEVVEGQGELSTAAYDRYRLLA